MLVFLVGHRGVGKTSLLQRYQVYGRGGFPVFDLDREIEKKSGQSIQDIFTHEGEAAFRKLEIDTLTALILNNKTMVCSLGAGFLLDQFVFPPDSEIVWVRRKLSDFQGRIFTDRPRLNPKHQNPIEEFRERFDLRESTYARHCDWVYLLPEGLSFPDENERRILGGRFLKLGGILTLRPDHFRNPKVFLDRIAKMDIDYFELRSDFLNKAELQFALETLPASKVLFSIRSRLDDDFRRALGLAAQVDYALERGDQIPIEASIVSLHDRPLGESLSDSVRLFEKLNLDRKIHFKWSPEIESLSDLEFVLNWQTQDPEFRSVLPRSSGGRWTWIRQWLKGRQKLNFFRDGDGSALDQPTVHEWMRTPNETRVFAAVLGSPVAHSYSPIEHFEFFNEKQVPFFAIHIEKDEFAQGLSLLEKCGLHWAAVTSPLKERAFEFSTEKSTEAKRLASVNTLTKTIDCKWRGHNTDLFGIEEMMDSCLIPGEQVIWGGGGVLRALCEVLPKACAYSVRNQAPREGSAQAQDPVVLVWAASPSADAPKFLNWKPRLILDLNYTENSRARAYALKVGAQYISGLFMFRSQAAAQQKEWA